MHDHLHTTNGLTGSSGSKYARPEHPDDVLTATHLTVDEKRAILASWASDARAVTDAPALRKLDDGQLVEIDEILAALKQLDDTEDEDESSLANLVPTRMRAAITRRRQRSLKGERRFRRFWRDDDDDDPPPCPVAARPWPILPLDAPEAVQAA